MNILEIGRITQNFGILDNGILGLSYYVCFLQFDRILNEKLKLNIDIFLIGVCSALTGNLISDCCGYLFQMQFYLAYKVAIGCLIGFAIIPICEPFRKKNRG